MTTEVRLLEYGMERNNEVETWEEVVLIYNSALKEVGTKLEILNDEFQHMHQYNPIEHIKSRLKTPQSIVKKLKKNNYESTIENMVKYVNDIAGIRVICSFISDIYRIAEMLIKQKDIQVISVKDYIQNPKPSGYKSYHLIITIPIFLSDRIVDAKVEIQIRTVAMDFWASLEHKIHYKFEGNVPQHIKQELVECANMSSELDSKMLALNKEVQKLANANEEDKSNPEEPCMGEIP
ncbi:MAG: GTP pyrophosphokinase family protein [Lachnospiraceae bacterium]|nr:GTP pyrophosphokinase family protein [Lachnospiraceae bacterium]